MDAGAQEQRKDYAAYTASINNKSEERNVYINNNVI